MCASVYSHSEIAIEAQEEVPLKKERPTAQRCRRTRWGKSIKGFCPAGPDCFQNSALVDHVDRFLGHGIEGGDCLGVGLKGALGDDQVGKFL